MRLAIAAVLFAAAAVADTRGVPPSKQHLYDGDQFKCTDGSATVPLSKVNDDYCDCTDGSDEPGTSACEAAKFFCRNEGFRGDTVSSMVVNDGVCDCCDGADEWESGKCANTCLEAGKEWREHLAERIKAVESGAAARKVYAEQGTAATAGASTKAAEASAKAEELTRRLAGLKEQKEALEAKAKAESALSSAIQNDAVAFALGLHKLDATSLARMVVTLARDADKKTEVVELAKAAAAATDSTEAAAATAEAAWPETDEVPVTQAADTSSIDGEISRVELEKRAADEDKEKADADSSTDFGPDGAFYPLKGKCLEIRLAQYTYKVCPFGDAKQDHTSLGTFEGWADGGHTTMNFRGGQSCWNGPARSMTVTFECGSEDRLLAVDEPSKCAYASRVSTPAACDAGAANELRLELGSVKHDEL